MKLFLWVEIHCCFGRMGDIPNRLARGRQRCHGDPEATPEAAVVTAGQRELGVATSTRGAAWLDAQDQAQAGGWGGE
jgi:hypothetical protein